MIFSFLKRPIWQQVLAAVFLGILFGMALSTETIKNDYYSFYEGTIDILKTIGNVFIRLIKMLIVPLVFFSILSAIATMRKGKAIGSISIKVVLLYLLTTAIAISMSLLLANLIFSEPSENNKQAIQDLVAKTQSVDASGNAIAPIDLGLNTDGITLEKLFNAFIPANIFDAFVNGNILQIIIFAIVTGIAVQMMGSGRNKELVHLLKSITEMISCMVTIVMHFAPFGVFAMIAWLVASDNANVVDMLLELIIIFYIACAVQIMFVYSGLLKILTKLSPLPFLMKMLPVQALGFSTSSSSATLPLTMQVAEDKIGVSKTVSSFSLPLGTTVNMDGTAIYLGIVTVFIANHLGITLTPNDYMIIILTSTLASIGTAGVPGAGMIMLSMVLASINMPIEGVAIVIGIDRILDMARTVVNVTGDVTVAVITDHSRKRLDEEQYHARND